MRKAIELAARGSEKHSAVKTSTQPRRRPDAPSNISLGLNTSRAFSSTSFQENRWENRPRSSPISRGHDVSQKRTFTSSIRQSAPYSDSIPNLQINKGSRVIYQGFTGKAVCEHLRRGFATLLRMIGLPGTGNQQRDRGNQVRHQHCGRRFAISESRTWDAPRPQALITTSL